MAWKDLELCSRRKPQAGVTKTSFKEKQQPFLAWSLTHCKMIRAIMRCCDHQPCSLHLLPMQELGPARDVAAVGVSFVRLLERIQ